jgi:hypothetical protein
MKKWLIILILIGYQASATVEDVGTGSISGSGDTISGTSNTGSLWPGSIGPPTMSLPTVSCPGFSGRLEVAVTLSGPTSEEDSAYTTPGKVRDYIVTVKNEGPSEVDASVSVNPETC